MSMWKPEWVCSMTATEPAGERLFIDVFIVSDSKLDAEVAAIRRMETIRPDLLWSCFRSMQVPWKEADAP